MSPASSEEVDVHHEPALPPSDAAHSPAHAPRTREIEAEASEVSDSRGRPTARVTLRLGASVGSGDVPAGASTGADEAQTVPASQALRNIRDVIIPLVRGANVDLREHSALVDLERTLIERAGDNYVTLGANAVVPVSRALWQLAAALRGMSLAAYIRRCEPQLASNRRVQFYMNIFNGGLHALQSGEVLGKDRIDFQEIMVVPVGATNYRDALMMGDRMDAVLKDLLTARFGAGAVSRADEAGFSVKGLGDSSAAIAMVSEAIERAGYLPGEEVKVALDVAASSLFDKATGTYRFQGKTLNSDDMIATLIALADRYKGRLLSIEDGLAEDDWEGWGKLSLAMAQRGVMTIGDDLFVTQIRRLRRGVNNKSAHAVLVKVNQNGSVLGTLEAMRYARDNGMETVVSHRSGETLDVSIADLAMATGALGLKSGDPQPEVDFPDRSTWVRRSKYLRMVRLEEGR